MEDINHPELVIPQLNLAIVRLKKKEYKYVLPELLELIPTLEANNKNTLALFARIIALLAMASQHCWDILEENLNEIENLLVQTQLIDSDIALLSEQTALSLHQNRRNQLAKRVYIIAKAQYKALKNPHWKKIQECLAKL